MHPIPNNRTWAEINREALLHNLAALREHLQKAVSLMAVVKANAYGHGVAPVVEALAGKVDWFGVANVQEAADVAALAPESKIMILGPVLPEEIPSVAEAGFVPVISDLDEARAFAACGKAKPVSVHLAVDTGMGRIGVAESDAVELARACKPLGGIRITGIGSHLPVSDEDDEYTVQQLARFHSLARTLRELDLVGGPLHIENSAGAIGFPGEAGDLVRAGLMLYGASPRPEFQKKLRPVLTWKARISLIRRMEPGRTVSYGRTYTVEKPMRVATLSVGYADGYKRHQSGRGAEVLIHSERCPVLGRITMDQIMVDVTKVPNAAVGDTAVLLGQQGAAEISAGEMADKAGTIPWEVFTGIGQRVLRHAI